MKLNGNVLNLADDRVPAVNLMCLVLMEVIFGKFGMPSSYLRRLNTDLVAFHGAIDTRFCRKKNEPSFYSFVYEHISLANDIISDGYPLPVLLSLNPVEYPRAIVRERKGLPLQLQAVTAMPPSLPRYDNEQGETSPF